MHPYFGSVPAYSVTLAAGVVVAALLGVWSLRRSGVTVGDCVRIQITLAVAGLLGAKLFSLYERGGYVATFTSELTQGYRYPGGIVAVGVVLAVLGRRLAPGRSLAALADAVAPSVGVGTAIVRLGCWLYGCCFGGRSELPWAMRFPAHSPAWDAHLAAGWIGTGAPASVPVHPLQLYFMALSLTAAAIAAWLQPRRAYVGQVALVFLVVDQLGKAGLETFRYESLPALRRASFMAGLIAAALLSVATVGHRAPRFKGTTGAGPCDPSAGS